MQRFILFFICSFLFILSSAAQVIQSARFELEKKNNDDFFTVAPADELGLVIIRDVTKEFSFKNKVDGDEWEITSLDTAMNERWKNELAIDYGYYFKAYDIYKGQLYMLFRDGEYEKNDYHLWQIDIVTGTVDRYDIKNELALNLSHITVVEERIVMAGYVRYSPTVVSYQVGTEKFEVIPGFFKDRSDIIDLKSNGNGTFNVLTLEKEYGSYMARLRTHAKDGTILFERQVDVADDFSILNGKSTDFVDGNIVLAGAYGGKNSNYSRGVYFSVVKPEGQDNVTSYIDFTELLHFFDYMRPKRAERIRAKIKRKNAAGKDYNYHSRLLLHDIKTVSDGFLVVAEVYDPRYERSGFPNTYPYNTYGQGYSQNYSNANYQYVRRPSTRVNMDDANHFEYLESIVLKINKQGKLLWDQSFTIDDVESASLDPVVDLTTRGDQVLMLYKNEENISYKKLVSADSTVQGDLPIKLKYDNDEIQHNYDLVGGTEFWYGDTFYVWGYHRVGNKVLEDVDKKRSVLFINKVRFE